MDGSGAPPSRRTAGLWPRPWWPATNSLILLGAPAPEGVRAEIATGRAPQVEHLPLADLLAAKTMSSADAERMLGGPLGRMLRRRPPLGAAVAGFLRRSEFDSIYVTGEDIGLRLAPLLKASRWRGRLVMVAHAVTSRSRKALLRALGPDSFAAIVCVCEAQRRILIDEVGFPPEKVRYFANWLDTDFFSTPGPVLAAQCDYAFSSGRENRDYETLFHAVADLPYRFKVAAAGFRHGGGDLAAAPPANTEVFESRISYPQLQQTYARARFAIVPLHAVPYAAGVTGITEAMAMGKAVIATASPGVAEYIEDGVTGRVVPPNDPAALAAAIADLWTAPERCDEMGRRNRAWIEANASVTRYAREIAAMMTGAPATEPASDLVAEQRPA